MSDPEPILPFETPPIMAAYLYGAFSTGILTQHSAFVLNANTQLYCRIGCDAELVTANNLLLEVLPQARLDYYSAIGALSITDVHHSDRPDIDPKELIAECSRLIANGSYVFAHVDLYYIPRSSVYRKLHMKHELLLIGGSERRATFCAVQYVQSGEFARIEVPFQLFATAFLSQEGLEDSFAYCRSFRLAAVNVVGDGGASQRLDLPMLRIYLEDYLNGRNTAFERVTDARLKRWVGPYEPPIYSAGSFGLSIYPAICSYFAMLASQPAHRPDLRVTRTLWEHKKLMVARVRRLMSEIGLSAEHLSTAEKTVTFAHRIHLSLYAALRSGRPADTAALNRDVDTLLGTEREMLEKIVAALSSYHEH